jgi:hypothetical protein
MDLPADETQTTNQQHPMNPVLKISEENPHNPPKFLTKPCATPSNAVFFSLREEGLSCTSG